MGILKHRHPTVRKGGPAISKVSKEPGIPSNVDSENAEVCVGAVNGMNVIIQHTSVVVVVVVK